MAQSHEEVCETPENEKEKISEGKSVEPIPDTEEMKKQYDDLNERFLRLAADFENYKKRIARDTDVRIKFAIEEFALGMLEVIDNFDRALKSEDEAAREGLEQISKLFSTILERYGIRPIEAMGKKFNPAEHEAIAYMPSDADEGIVIDQVCQGYCMNDKVIRCAKVAVSKGRQSE